MLAVEGNRSSSITLSRLDENLLGRILSRRSNHRPNTEYFGYTIDVKTSRDVSAFRPANILENDPDDDIIVMVWHRDNEDALILLGWERTETLKSKATTQEAYSGEEPAKLAHLAARPMNELHDLGLNTTHLNQKPENPFKPGDRVVKAGVEDASVAVVVEVLPPEKNTTAYRRKMDGEALL